MKTPNTTKPSRATTRRNPVQEQGAAREPAAAYDARGGEIMLYQAPDGKVRLDVRLERETIWLNLNQMAALFERDKSVISRHLRKVYREGELEQESTIAFFATVQEEGGLYGPQMELHVRGISPPEA